MVQTNDGGIIGDIFTDSFREKAYLKLTHKGRLQYLQEQKTKLQNNFLLETAAFKITLSEIDSEINSLVE